MSGLPATRVFNRALGELLSRRNIRELNNPFLLTQIKSVLFITIIAIAIMSIYAVIYLGTGQWPIAAYEIFAIGSLIINITHLKYTRNVQLTTNIIMAVMLPLFLILIYTGGLAHSGLIWIFLFPSGAFYLSGLRDGIRWMAVLYASFGTLIAMQIAGVIHTAYDTKYLFQIMLVLAVSAFIIYLHERITDSARQSAFITSARQERLNQQLAVTASSLEQAKLQYEALIESIGDGIVATDAEGKILLVNTAALGLLKLRRKDMIGHFVTVFRAEDESGRPIPARERILSQVLRTNKTMHTTASSHYYYVDSGGRRFPVASTQAPIIMNGENAGAVFVFRDVTEEKKLDEAKSELVSLASHQLNGPLTAVSWYTEMLLSGEAGKLTMSQKEYLDEIYAGTTKMVELVSDFLNASRIELGTFVPKFQPIDVVATATAALGEINPEIVRKKLTLKRKFEKVGILNLDRRTIQIILQNLLTNAVKYTDSGSITIAIYLSGSGRRQRLHIDVSDTGLGIPPADLPRIFQKMYRAENAKLAEAEGTGLGLYIIKSIVDQLHGTITMDSELGKGTSFRVELPAPAVVAPQSSIDHHRR